MEGWRWFAKWVCEKMVNELDLQGELWVRKACGNSQRVRIWRLRAIVFKNDTKGFHKGFAYPVFFRIGCEVKDRELEFFKNHQEDFAEGAKFSHALRNGRSSPNAKSIFCTPCEKFAWRYAKCSASIFPQLFLCRRILKCPPLQVNIKNLN